MEGFGVDVWMIYWILKRVVLIETTFHTWMVRSVVHLDCGC